MGKILEQLILPPGGFIIFSLLGLVLMRTHRQLGFYITTGGLFLLYIASLPIVANALLHGLEPETSLSNKISTNQTTNSEQTPPQAIVILGAGRNYNTPEFGGDTPNAYALERIRYGVWLARRTLLPILVTGGLGGDEILPEAKMMKQVIESEYALPVRWAETKSHTTHENAEFSSEILKAEGIESIYLVTHAGHMKRSVISFEKFGLTIHPAPTAFGGSSKRKLGLNNFLPSASALKRTALVFHEWVGMGWYWVRY